MDMPDTTIRASDGTPLKAYLATPVEAGRHPGVVVIQDALGLTAPYESTPTAWRPTDT